MTRTSLTWLLKMPIRNQRSNCQHPLDHQKSKEIQKNIYFCFIDYAKTFNCVDHKKLENSSRDGNTRPLNLPPEKSVCRSRSNSFKELDMEQQTGSKLGKECIKAVYCHPAYLNYQYITYPEIVTVWERTSDLCRGK